MTHRSLSKQPIPCMHLECETEWEQHTIEWPPQIIVCTGCGQVLVLCDYDTDTRTVYFRHL